MSSDRFREYRRYIRASASLTLVRFPPRHDLPPQLPLDLKPAIERYRRVVVGQRLCYLLNGEDKR